MAESIVTHPADEALHAHRARLDQCACPYCVPSTNGPGVHHSAAPEIVTANPPFVQFDRRPQ